MFMGLVLVCIPTLTAISWIPDYDPKPKNTAILIFLICVVMIGVTLLMYSSTH